MKHNIAILQPEVPHYRTEFFNRLKQCVNSIDIFVFNSIEQTKKAGFNIDSRELLPIANRQWHGFLLYNPFTLIKRHDVLVVMLHFGHITTWLLLLTKWLHRKKIILWGQGISVKRYLKESYKPDWKLRWLISLADGVWLYTEKERLLWAKMFPQKNMVALGNSLSDVEEMLTYKSTMTKNELKEKYKITQKHILIFCARFESPFRRTDLLLEAINRLDHRDYGFVIIGAGSNKPDFSPYSNVYDFGAIYDQSKKRELFSLADLYFQPGWVGLSAVEAMAYGKPICTFVRSKDTFQCVEYGYIEHGSNGLIFQDINDCINKIQNLSEEKIIELGNNAKKYVEENLTPTHMVQQAKSVIENL